MEKELEINKERYISFEEHEKILAEKIAEGKIKEKVIEKPKDISAKRFTPSVASKLLKQLDTIFTNDGNSVIEDIDKDICVIDPANVCLVIGKSEEAKRLLCIFINPEVEQKNIPNLTFKGDEEAKSQYSLEYFNKIMNVLNSCDLESIWISTQHDYPIRIENKHFAFILAPRVSGEEE